MIRKYLLLFLAVVCVSASAQMSENPAKIADPLKSFEATLPYYDFSAGKPWHLVASYTAYDQFGLSVGSGTFELWWAGPRNTRATWQRGDARYSQWITPDGKRLEAGSGNVLSPFETALPVHLTDPLPARRLFDSGKVDVRRAVLTEGGQKLRCLMPVSKRSLPGMQNQPEPQMGGAFTWCFEPGQPILRMSYGVGMLSTLYDDAALFDGHYIPRHLVARDAAGRRRVDLRVSVIEPIAANDAALVAPADARPAERRVRIAEDVAAARVVKSPVPVYPASAKARRLTGTVVLAATIAKDGGVRDLHVLKSPDAALSRAAMDAVRAWRYKPYAVGKEALAVDTTIRVSFPPKL